MAGVRARRAVTGNALFYGDNLDVLRKSIPDESVDLIYLDPPFNSNRSYNVLFKSHSGTESQAQIEAFDDTWHWSTQTETTFIELAMTGQNPEVAKAITAMRDLLGPNDVLAYLVMMTPRLVELHRVLKPTGSMYLHCDPTASHYLKVMLDAIFGPTNFRNEIVWKRADAKGDAGGQGAKHFGRVNDTILFYSKGPESTFNALYGPLDEDYVNTWYRHSDPDGRRYKLDNMTGPGGAAKGNPYYEVMGVGRYWRYSKKRMEALIAEGRVVQTNPGTVPMYKRYLDESLGTPITANWSDISFVRGHAAEKLGYPTQKPLALLERIIAASSNEDDVILDPFCGCGTAVDAAQKMRRQWIGIDVTYLAVDLIQRRLHHSHGPEIAATYTVHGIPADVDGAHVLFASNPFDFERWAVSLVDGRPNEKQTGDRGIDGRVVFPTAVDRLGLMLASVKGGKAINPGMVRDLVGTVRTERAEMGLLITLSEPTRGMRDAAKKAGTFTHDLTGRTFPKVQIITIEELFVGKRPEMPTPVLPYVTARAVSRDQLSLGV